MKNKDQQAQQYAEKIMQDAYSEEWDSEYVEDLIEQAYIDGYTACEQSMWRSVEEELPEENQTCLCHLDDGEYIVARFDHMDVYSDDAGEELYAVPEWWVENGCESYTLGSEIIHWMPITLPSIHDTNTEKK